MEFAHMGRRASSSASGSGRAGNPTAPATKDTSKPSEQGLRGSVERYVLILLWGTATGVICAGGLTRGDRRIANMRAVVGMKIRLATNRASCGGVT